MRDMLGKYQEQRQALQTQIKNFRAGRVAPPSALQIQVDGTPVQFKIDPSTGQVSELPTVGVWGWAARLSWRDLKKFLEERDYQVMVA